MALSVSRSRCSCSRAMTDAATAWRDTRGRHRGDGDARREGRQILVVWGARHLSLSLSTWNSPSLMPFLTWKRSAVPSTRPPPKNTRQTNKQNKTKQTKQTNKQTSKQANKQTNKQANKQTNKQTKQKNGPSFVRPPHQNHGAFDVKAARRRSLFWWVGGGARETATNAPSSGS